ncbi:MAG: class I SAM-dependent methyltransferase [Acidimicrobiia bacterium]
MCNPSCKAYGVLRLQAVDVRDKRVIEVGARNVNGSLRHHIESLGPASYLGVDIEPGRGVDEICTAEDLVERYGSAVFDVVVCTEVLEHVRDWRRVVANIKEILAPEGILLVTTRSHGFPYHAFPYDFWRYEISDVYRLFDDMEILDVESDTTAPGVFLTARQPQERVEPDLSGVALYSIVTKRRTVDLADEDLDRFVQRQRRRRSAGKLVPTPVKTFLKRRLKV